MSPATRTRTAAAVKTLPPSMPPSQEGWGENGLAKVPRNSSFMARFASTPQSSEPVDPGAPFLGRRKKQHQAGG